MGGRKNERGDKKDEIGKTLSNTAASSPSIRLFFKKCYSQQRLKNSSYIVIRIRSRIAIAIGAEFECFVVIGIVI